MRLSTYPPSQHSTPPRSNKLNSRSSSHPGYPPSSSLSRLSGRKSHSSSPISSSHLPPVLFQAPILAAADFKSKNLKHALHSIQVDPTVSTSRDQYLPTSLTSEGMDPSLSQYKDTQNPAWKGLSNESLSQPELSIPAGPCVLDTSALDILASASAMAAARGPLLESATHPHRTESSLLVAPDSGFSLSPCNFKESLAPTSVIRAPLINTQNSAIPRSYGPSTNILQPCACSTLDAFCRDENSSPNRSQELWTRVPSSPPGIPNSWTDLNARHDFNFIYNTILAARDEKKPPTLAWACEKIMLRREAAPGLHNEEAEMIMWEEAGLATDLVDGARLLLGLKHS
ncbi:hypothetical protein OF83DRAFT_366773 [Amylostereum chailletii]|nr:hypothetical protein OF83DRAFT_366773 [Amylostereum chailletii]